MPKTLKTIKGFFFHEGNKHRLKKDTKVKKTLTKKQMSRVYKAWERLNHIILQVGGGLDARVPIPGLIGESLAAMHEKCRRIGSRNGDLYDRRNKSLIEVKSSTSDAPTSFTTKSMAGSLRFVDIKRNGDYSIYQLTKEEMESLKIKKGLTLKTLQESNSKSKNPGARGRLNLRNAVEKLNRPPKYWGNLFN